VIELINHSLQSLSNELFDSFAALVHHVDHLAAAINLLFMLL